jgi:putative ubiquitin-RnfH superfamily antitoxin RatB of RatAB toxin-antitoxin module
VAVAYVGPEEEFLRSLEVPAGTTAGEAVSRSGALEQCPEIDLASHKLGIFGKLVRSDQALAEGDRVEIYRPLIADPKEARKRRAEEGKALKKGGA